MRDVSQSAWRVRQSGTGEHMLGARPWSGEGGSGRTISYSAEQLRGRTIPELIEILKARGLSGCRGKKEELIQRILDAQERGKRAAQS